MAAVVLQIKDIDGKLINEKNIEVKEGSKLIVSVPTDLPIERCDELITNLENFYKSETGILLISNDVQISVLDVK